MTIPDDVPAAQPGGRAATLLQLMWLASPTLPIGGFSYSEGLEAAIEAQHLHDEASVDAWLCDQLHLGLGRSDLVVVAQALEAWRANNLDRLKALNNWVHQTRESDEFRQQTVQMGSSFMTWRKSLGDQSLTWPGPPEAAVTYPIAFASAAATTQATAQEALLAYAFGWAENMVQAAIKAVPLGQSAGQRILLALQHDIPSVVEAALACDDDSRQAFTPVLAVLSAQHEMQYSRLFRS